MTRGTTPRFTTTMTVALALLVAGLLTGRIEAVVLACPLLVALALSVALASEPTITVLVDTSIDRCFERDEVTVTVRLVSDDRTDVEVGLQIPPGLAPVGVGPAIRTVMLQPGVERSLSFVVVPVRWGVYRLGLVALRVTGPGGSFTWEGLYERHELLKVFPHVERVETGVAPSDTQVYSGNYPSRGAGAGIEFSHVRPFERGDRLRSINWRVTSRRNEMHVNVFHPERNSEVVIFLDTFADAGTDERSSLDVAVRGAAGVAQHYLRHKDKVGIVAFGGILRWLTTSMSRTQVYRIIDLLLESQALFSYAWKNVDLLPRGTLPPSALVIAFSPLIDRRAIGALGDISARGFTLVIIDTLAEDDVPPLPGREGEVARRVWKLHREAVRAEFAAIGVPVLQWHEQVPLDALLASLPSDRSRLGAPR